MDDCVDFCRTGSELAFLAAARPRKGAGVREAEPATDASKVKLGGQRIGRNKEDESALPVAQRTDKGWRRRGVEGGRWRRVGPDEVVAESGCGRAVCAKG